MNERLQEILTCPITGEALKVLDSDKIEELNSLILKEEVKHFEGTAVRRILNSGFISENDQFVYRFEDGVAFLLKDLAIVVKEHEVDFNSETDLSTEKMDVQGFYDQIGWQKNEEGLYIDTQKFVDTRSICQDYHRKCQLRIGRHLKSKGKYILDAGCGPVPHPERLSYQGKFDIRICADISFLALKNAKKSLGDKGVYLLCDNTNLPLKDNIVDAAVCLHNIYHIPKDEQKTAIEEIARVLQPNSSAVIAYTWGGHSVLMKLAFLPMSIIRVVLIRPCKIVLKGLRKLKALLISTTKVETSDNTKDVPENPAPVLYFYAHNYKYFTEQKWNFKFDILVLRSISNPFTKTFVHKWLFSKLLLAVIYWLEELCPHIAGRLGAYPLFIIRK